ncbi:ATP-binding protein [Nonomuraea sp. NPDC050556]|uniref:ATP-binding protein n=1 Tax=Nonomuraea sp. NPDC050556 TaxID=3364369 RepID=UPI0037B7F284
MDASDHNQSGDEAYFADGVPLPDEDRQGDAVGSGKLAPELVKMAEDAYRLIRADDGRSYAVPKLGAAVAVPLASKGGSGLRAKLATSLYRRTGRVSSGAELSDAINVLAGEASEQDPQPVYLRMARHTTPGDHADAGAIVVDMGTETGEAIVITGDGWRIDPVSPVIFRRSELTHPMVTPVRGGTLDGLRALINLSEEDWRLAIAWVVAAYLTDIPHPILTVKGEQGTAKSNLIRSLLLLIDPQPAADREPPGSQREWAIFARASWAFSFDNVTDIPDWLSNSLCKGVTGDAVLQRALHSDEDITVFAFQRVIAMTSIEFKHPLAGDLVDRMLLIEPEVIDVRLTEQYVRAAREQALPLALGAVLDLVAGVLAALPAVHTTDLPRMADFARVLAALDKVTGWTTVKDYRTRIAAMGMTLIEGNTLARVLYYFATPQPWEGETSDLLTGLRRVAAEHGLPASQLPADVRTLGTKLSEIAPSLRKVGVDIRKRKSGAKRYISVIKKSDDPQE